VYRLDAGQGQVALLAPCEEIPYGSGVGPPRIADRGCEELDEAFTCPLSGLGDDRGQDQPAGGF